MSRFWRLAPEEIVGALLLVLAIAFVAVRPTVITQRFEAPYATPAPEGGPARSLVPAVPTAAPPAASASVRTIRVGPAPAASLQPGFGPLPLAPIRCPDGSVPQGGGGVVSVCVLPMPQVSARP